MKMTSANFINSWMVKGENKTAENTIHLLGFQVLYNYKISIFLITFVLYSLTLTGNVIIVTLVSTSPNLHHPMFFFLSHLSMSDIILSTTTVPNMLSGIVKGRVTMSVTACIIQFQFFGVAIMSECLILAVMSYDRYLAICSPLQYIPIMDNMRRLQLVTFCWFVSITVSFLMMSLVSRLRFCGPNIIYHFFCDFTPILQLSCTQTFVVELIQKLLAFPITVIPVIFIIVTYVKIIRSIFRIPSGSGRQKAYSTCSSHLAVVGIFYGSLITLYVFPSSGQTLNANRIISLLYTVVTPLFNPIIYSMRNMEIRVALSKCIRNKNGNK